MNRFRKIVVTSIVISLGIAIPTMSMENLQSSDTQENVIVSPQVTSIMEKPAKHHNNSTSNKRKHYKKNHTATNVDTQPITILTNEVEKTVEVIKEVLPVKVVDSQTLSELSTELNTIVDKGNSCCLWCISETTQVAQDLNELIVEISKVDQAVESNVTAITQLVDTIKDFNGLTPEEQKLKKNNLKVNMKSTKAALEHHKIVQKNKTANNEIKVVI